MNLKEILQYKLIEMEDFDLTVLNLVMVAGIVLFTIILLYVLRKIIERPSNVIISDGGRRHSIFLLVKYIVWIVSIITCLQVTGVQITILLAGSAALLVGLGIGIQQIFNDLVSGIFLLFEGTIQVKDVIEVDGMICKVTEINLRTSKVVSRDDITIIIPNHNFINEKVINWSRQTTRFARFHIEVGVSYKSDPQKVREVLMGCMEGHPDILNTPSHAPLVRFKGFGDSSLDFDMLFWSARTFRIENVMSDIRFKVFKALKENGIEIPFPQRDIHFRSSEVPLFKASDSNYQ